MSAPFCRQYARGHWAASVRLWRGLVLAVVERMGGLGGCQCGYLWRVVVDIPGPLYAKKNPTIASGWVRNVAPMYGGREGAILALEEARPFAQDALLRSGFFVTEEEARRLLVRLVRLGELGGLGPSVLVRKGEGGRLHFTVDPPEVARSKFPALAALVDRGGK